MKSVPSEVTRDKGSNVSQCKVKIYICTPFKKDGKELTAYKTVKKPMHVPTSTSHQ